MFQEATNFPKGGVGWFYKRTCFKHVRPAELKPQITNNYTCFMCSLASVIIHIRDNIFKHSNHTSDCVRFATSGILQGKNQLRDID